MCEGGRGDGAQMSRPVWEGSLRTGDWLSTGQTGTVCLRALPPPPPRRISASRGPCGGGSEGTRPDGLGR